MCGVIPCMRWTGDDRSLTLLCYNGDAVLGVSIFKIWVIQILNVFKTKFKP